MNIHQLEQYIILQSLDKILKYHNDADKVAYKNIISVHSDHPELTFNRIISCPLDIYEFYNNLTDLQKSFLTPKIVIYAKSINEQEEVVEAPIKLRSYFDGTEFRNFVTDPSSFDINAKREDGVGLKSIKINDRSERPSDVHISCQMVFYFENILAIGNNDILKLITTPEIRLKDSGKDFRIKLVVGWETPYDSSGNVFSSKEIDIIEKSNLIYYLELVDHELNFQANGSIVLTINYQGAMEKYFSYNSDSDIFKIFEYDVVNAISKNTQDSDKILEYFKISSEIDEKEKDLALFYKNSNKGVSTESLESDPTKMDEEKNEKIKKLESELDELKAKKDDLEVFAIKEKYAKLINGINNSKRLFHLIVDERYLTAIIDVKIKDSRQENAIAALASLQSKGPFVTPSKSNIGWPTSIESQINDATDNEDLQGVDNEESAIFRRIQSFLSSDILQNFLKNDDANPITGPFGFGTQFWINAARGLGATIPTSAPLNDRPIHYIMLGDLVNIAAGFLDYQEEMNVILGPCKIGSFNLSLSQFPISVNAFTSWFVNKVVRKVRKQYYFWEFINDIIKDLVTPNIIASPLIDKDKNISLTVAATTVISSKKLERGKIYSDSNLMHYLSRPTHDTTKIYSYLILYAFDYQMAKRDGIYEEDIKDGIYHFGIGRNRGIIKNINFPKIDFPKYRDMRIAENKLNTPGGILRRHYNAELSTIGNPLFLNGGLFYFDGSFLGDAGRMISEMLGLGGYYRVTGMELNFDTAKYETIIHGTWESMRLTSEEALAQSNNSSSISTNPNVTKLNNTDTWEVKWENGAYVKRKTGLGQ